MHPLVKYCQFGVSPVNHSDSDSEEEGEVPGTHPSNFILLIVPRRYFVVVIFFLSFGVECLRRSHLMYVFILLIKFGYLSGRLLGNSCSLGLQYVFSV